MSKPLIPSGGDDVVFTPDYLAKQIIDHFKPTGRILEPCRGKGAFSNLMPGCDWCEITEGRDFFNHTGHYQYILTNPPFSQFRAFLKHSMRLADNIIFLAPTNHFWLKARMRDIKEAGFGFKEILMVDTPKKETGWPQSGFQLSATWLQKNWTGDCKITNLSEINYYL